jgi:hypothetical protein
MFTSSLKVCSKLACSPVSLRDQVMRQQRRSSLRQALAASLSCAHVCQLAGAKLLESVCLTVSGACSMVGVSNINATSCGTVYDVRVAKHMCARSYKCCIADSGLRAPHEADYIDRPRQERAGPTHVSAYMLTLSGAKERWLCTACVTCKATPGHPHGVWSAFLRGTILQLLEATSDQASECGRKTSQRAAAWYNVVKTWPHRCARLGTRTRCLRSLC